METVILAAGCFWGVEDTFRNLNGVIKTEVGYTGGHTVNPNYQQVCTGTTGHAEAVKIKFDNSIISFQQLLEVFWKCHDPTQGYRQGPDIGTQYRSAIFYFKEDQKQIATIALQNLESSGQFNTMVTTEITQTSEFYRAENYHQQYFEKRGVSSCKI